MQVCGSPHDVESVVSCTLAVLNVVVVVMDTDMVPFLETIGNRVHAHLRA